MLVLSLLLGCAHFSTSGNQFREAVPEVAVIGWRLVPGQELNYRHTVRLLRGDREIARTESWAYLVRDVTPTGEVLLEGRLTGLGTLRREKNTILSQASLAQVEQLERDRLGSQTVTIRLSLDGHVLSVSGLSWEDSLPHHALGLVFPDNPIEVGHTWAYPGSIAPYRNLVPPEVNIVPQTEIRLVSFYSNENGVFASVDFQGQIQAGGEGLPQIETHGEGVWDLVSGQLYQQKQRVSLSQYSEPFGGLLLIETERQPQ